MSHKLPVYQHIKVHRETPIWTAEMSRPEALNALNSKVLTELDHFLNEVKEAFPQSCRALILTGEGEKAFVAGADIRELNALDAGGGSAFAQKGQNIFHKIELLPVPVVAAVNGFALGGGFELALSCDWIMASENAKFGLPEVGLGLIPGFGGTIRLARVVGTPRARQMIFSGEMISASQAYELGIANWVGSQGELILQARKLLGTVLEKAPQAVAHAKKSILQTYDMDMHQANKFEAHQFTELFRFSDFKEGTSAFLEKRKAQFTGQ